VLKIIIPSAGTAMLSRLTVVILGGKKPWSFDSMVMYAEGVCAKRPNDKKLRNALKKSVLKYIILNLMSE